MFLDNKYTKWYNIIINNANIRKVTEYTEKHHIIPKSLGGTDENINLVQLTAREHYVCHRLLTKMTEGKQKSKMCLAIVYMSGKKKYTNASSRLVAKVRLESVELCRANKHSPTYKRIVSDTWKKEHSIRMTGAGNPMYNSVRPEEWRQQHSKRMRGKNNHQYGLKGKLSLNFGKEPVNKNKTLSELFGKNKALEISKRQSESAKNKPKITCPHCQLVGTTGNMKRWHYDNCKNKETRNE